MRSFQYDAENLPDRPRELLGLRDDDRQVSFGRHKSKDLLRELVGAWGFEPQTPTVSSTTPAVAILTKLLSKIQTVYAASAASPDRTTHFRVPNCVPSLIPQRTTFK